MNASRRGFPGEKRAPKYVKRISIQAKLGSIGENRSLECFNHSLRFVSILYLWRSPPHSREYFVEELRISPPARGWHWRHDPRGFID
jgi:hypothetical protein